MVSYMPEISWNLVKPLVDALRSSPSVEQLPSLCSLCGTVSHDPLCAHPATVFICRLILSDIHQKLDGGFLTEQGESKLFEFLAYMANVLVKSVSSDADANWADLYRQYQLLFSVDDPLN
jgi:hypothetical protein